MKAKKWRKAGSECHPFLPQPTIISKAPRPRTAPSRNRSYPCGVPKSKPSYTHPLGSSMGREDRRAAGRHTSSGHHCAKPGAHLKGQDRGSGREVKVSSGTVRLRKEALKVRNAHGAHAQITRAAPKEMQYALAEQDSNLGVTDIWGQISLSFRG